MFCVLTYIDYLNYKRYQNESLSTLRSLISSEHDPVNSTLYFNPNCILQLILDYICTEAHISIDGERHDLCNASGDLLGIRDYKPTISGMTIFRPREMYFIAVIKRTANGNEIHGLIPMLNPNTDIFDTMLRNLILKNVKRKSSISTTRRSSSKTSMTLSQSSNTSATNSKVKRRSSAGV